MHDAGVELLQFGRVEARGRTAEMGEIETVEQRLNVGNRLHRIGRADTGEQCDHGQRLYPRLAQRIHSRAAEPLRKRSVRARDQRRSEEHTSERQSLLRTSYAVFCLKKKK